MEGIVMQKNKQEQEKEKIKLPAYEWETYRMATKRFMAYAEELQKKEREKQNGLSNEFCGI
jgi:hypothetical protein